MKLEFEVQKEDLKKVEGRMKMEREGQMEKMTAGRENQKQEILKINEKLNAER